MGYQQTIRATLGACWVPDAPDFEDFRQHTNSCRVLVAHSFGDRSFPVGLCGPVSGVAVAFAEKVNEAPRPGSQIQDQGRNLERKRNLTSNLRGNRQNSGHGLTVGSS